MTTLRTSTVLTLLLSFLIIGKATAEESRKGLAAFVWVSDAPNESDPRRTVGLSFVTGETAYCSFVVKGFQAGKDGRLDLHADCELLDPTGKVMLLKKDYAKTTGVIEASRPLVQLDKSLDLSFEANDSLGLYSIKLIVTDRVARTTAETTQKIRLFDSQATRDLFKQPIREAKQLDALWRYYFDTHDEFAVRRIISVLPWHKEGHGMQIVLGGAAEWSLRSNAYQHEDVYSICQKALGEADDERMRTLLAGLLAEVDKRKAEATGNKRR